MKRLKITVPILICGVVIALVIRRFYPQAEFKIVGLVIIAGMVAIDFLVTAWLQRPRGK